MSGNVWSHSIRLHQASLGKSDKCVELFSFLFLKMYPWKMSNFSFQQNAWYHYPKCCWRKNELDATMAQVWFALIIFAMHISTIQCLYCDLHFYPYLRRFIRVFYPDEQFNFVSVSLYAAVQLALNKQKRMESFIGSKKRTTLKADQILWGRDIVQCKTSLFAA